MKNRKVVITQHLELWVWLTLFNFKISLETMPDNISIVNWNFLFLHDNYNFGYHTKNLRFDRCFFCISSPQFPCDTLFLPPPHLGGHFNVRYTHSIFQSQENKPNAKNGKCICLVCADSWQTREAVIWPYRLERCTPAYSSSLHHW